VDFCHVYVVKYSKGVFMPAIYEDNGNRMVITKYHGDFENKEVPAHASTAMMLDVETTGLSAKEDEIIQLAYVTFTFDEETGEIFSIEQESSEYNEPEKEISEVITDLTGITAEDVKGKRIDWSSFELVLEDCEFVIAHNASFDRKFVEMYSEASRNILWACSREQVPWKSLGFGHTALIYVSMMNGFFYDAHNAIADVHATIKNLAEVDRDGKYFLKHLLERARQDDIKIIATTRYSQKQFFKDRQYRWDGGGKVWYKQLPQNAHQEELVEAQAFFKREGVGSVKIETIPAVNKFKDTSGESLGRKVRK